MNIEMMSMMLEGKGFAIDSATRGTLALEIIKTRFELTIQGKGEMYKIIFLDYSMPEMDGP